MSTNKESPKLLDDSLQEEIRLSILKQIGLLAESWENLPLNKSPIKRDYSVLPFWYHTQCSRAMAFRFSHLAPSDKIYSFTPDIEFLTPFDETENTPNSIRMWNEFLNKELIRPESNHEADKKLKVCSLKVNFCNWNLLKLSEDEANKDEIKDLNNSESARARLQSHVVLLLDLIMRVGADYGLRFVISEVDLSHTDASLRAVFAGLDGFANPMKREQELEVLDLSRTKTSSRSMVNFQKANRLKVLILDDCYSVRRTKDKAESNVFSLLQEHPISSLEVLSLVGTSTILNSHKWIDQVEKRMSQVEDTLLYKKTG